MHKIETHIEIAASATQIWSLLTDFQSYRYWNPFIRSVEGEVVVGKSLKVFIQPHSSKGMRFKPTVLAAEPNRELRWKGNLLLPGLFDGEHYFKIESAPERVVFHQGEVFTGILVPLFKSSLDGATKQGFISMNVALKHRAESNLG